MHVFGVNFTEVAGVTDSSFENRLEPIIYTFTFLGGEYTGGNEPVAVGHTRAHIDFKQSAIEVEGVIKLRKGGIGLACKSSTPKVFAFGHRLNPNKVTLTQAIELGSLCIYA